MKLCVLKFISTISQETPNAAAVHAVVGFKRGGALLDAAVHLVTQDHVYLIATSVWPHDEGND